MFIYEAIDTHMKNCGIKQTFVAEECGFSKQKLNKILKGGQKLEADDYAKICGALNLPFSHFYEAAYGQSDPERSA